MSDINSVIDFISTLPGLGQKSARRIALAMVKDKKNMMYRFADMLNSVADSVQICKICHNLDISDVCKICNDHTRDKTKICILIEIGDLWNIEKSGHYNGLYHVVGSNMSYSSSSNKDSIDRLIERIKKENYQEIIIAMSATVESQTTAFYITDLIKEAIDQLQGKPEITVLGKGMPVGSELDYLDEGTIGAAFKTRKIAE